MGMSNDYEIAVEEGATLVRLGTILFGARADMIDETFHLTPLDVRRYEFGKALRGYDPERVDQFREQVAEELERLTRLNQELEAKARGFHEQLRAFRERDKAHQRRARLRAAAARRDSRAGRAAKRS